MPKDKAQSSGESGMGYSTSLALAIRFGCGHRIGSLVMMEVGCLRQIFQPCLS